MGNGISKVLPDLYLGNFKDARDRELLARHNITHILSIHDTAAPILEEMTYLCISAADHSKQNLIQYFRDSIMFIHESRLKGEGCLVHCVAGVSRSVTLVVAYIMTVTGCGWVESLAAVRAARPCAGPNLGFLRQLEEFENIDLAEYRAWWKDRYGKSSLNDEGEIEALLTQKSNCSSSSSAMSTNTAPALATSGT
ncbi:dual specificity protein phosphatase 22 [Seriola lalandi dorsalis]|uniref:Dual specificity phosphatase 22 n=1 Tax=Seriola lalandi dorsalis TaxID=1841481 RepID=A0A3B4Y8R5_SERLL|nr:dual specificity protein phosphatase 22 [Seriola lalandi dorsalis]XP_056233717.1 dual specificity protein phosphatase 22-B-like [Seriola aureovittata]